MLYCKEPDKTAIGLPQKLGLVMNIYRFYNELNLRQWCL